MSGHNRLFAGDCFHASLDFFQFFLETSEQETMPGVIRDRLESQPCGVAHPLQGIQQFFIRRGFSESALERQQVYLSVQAAFCRRITFVVANGPVRAEFQPFPRDQKIFIGSCLWVIVNFEQIVITLLCENLWEEVRQW